MKIEVLLSTMNQNDFSLLGKMNINSDVTVVNQCEMNGVNKFTFRQKNVTWINQNIRGLSKSRNCAIEYATEDICILADDDLIYIDGYDKIIIEQFKKYPKADIIAFQVEGIEQTFKKYRKKPKRINFLTIMKISSVEIAFRKKSIKSKKLKFDERFGAGAKYSAGEENIFLSEGLKKGLKIQYVPIKIADLHIGDSSWFKGYNKEYFKAKGAVFAAMSKKLALPYILQFAIRKNKLYKKEINIKVATNFMYQGMKEFLTSLIL